MCLLILDETVSAINYLSLTKHSHSNKAEPKSIVNRNQPLRNSENEGLGSFSLQGAEI